MEYEASKVRAERKKQYATKNPEDFQVPKWMLQDNHPETVGKGSPGATGATKTGARVQKKSGGEGQGKWRKMLNERKKQHDM